MSKGKPIKDIHKKLIEETIQAKKNGLATSDTMLKQAKNNANALKKRIGSKSYNEGYVKISYGDNIPESEILSILVFDLINKVKVEKRLSHEITLEADKQESKSKEETFKNSYENNRKNERIFYLASWHKDSASDHRDYQGKIYIDEKWRNVIQDKELKERVRNYVQTHQVKTVQWVTGKPVWFITRPNCRHYFKELGVDEVLGESVKSLLEKHNMESAIGKREYLQTINHSMNKEWFDDVRNAELLVDKYRNRLALHEAMWKNEPNQVLSNAIKKDTLLIKKWRNYIVKRKRK